jgi:hypothetical protein
MLDRVIALVSLGVTIISWFSPSLWPQIPGWVAQLGVYFGVLLLGVAIGIFVVKHTTKNTGELTDSAAFKLHSYGDNRTPQCISSNNIWRWYYLRNRISVINTSDGSMSVSMVSILFITFERPVKISTLHVSSPDVTLPNYEVKEFNNRFAIIVFSDEIPAGTLDIYI